MREFLSIWFWGWGLFAAAASIVILCIALFAGDGPSIGDALLFGVMASIGCMTASAVLMYVGTNIDRDW